MTDRKTQKRRLNDAGFRYVAAWLPEDYAQKVRLQAAIFRPEVAAVIATPLRPGRQPKPKP
jgi:hypothetical protein